MFARPVVFLYAFFALVVLAAATPNPENAKRWGSPPATTTTVTVTAPASTPTSVSTCSTGGAQCCNSVTSTSDPATSVLLGLLGIVVQGIGATVGLDCSPINVVGVSGGTCDQQAVCCQDNSNSLVSIGCLPIQL
ncbi:uncharacterized protein PHACADRAFT_97873 [Phanerochaete carnosa HHB-10118-sp]|uniref:Hydrophobin n=1 Tax=Phanerochaete carnosa (strain HHB-10118-sp) TaxID=650164 RepID=K5VRK8_PHACS|nr:uncharacterized protein PHACADRAFT_97873 [Phanerochaete carnosa HHB-10118-sp]EKM54143.1 hypothetical protein PHACADRAFT_97873 [Phanerochaete carnosa HHB-10118-sp]